MARRILGHGLFFRRFEGTSKMPMVIPPITMAAPAVLRPRGLPVLPPTTRGGTYDHRRASWDLLPIHGYPADCHGGPRRSYDRQEPAGSSFARGCLYDRRGSPRSLPRTRDGTYDRRRARGASTFPMAIPSIAMVVSGSPTTAVGPRYLRLSATASMTAATARAPSHVPATVPTTVGGRVGPPRCPWRSRRSPWWP